MNASPTSYSDNLRYWLPPLAWMAMIFYFSTDTFSGEATGSCLESILGYLKIHLSPEILGLTHYLIRKAAHFTEYGILTALLYRAFRGRDREIRGWKWFIRTIALVAVYALLDEYHQSFTSTRTPSIHDSAIDVTGGLAMLCLIRLFAEFKGRGR